MNTKRRLAFSGILIAAALAGAPVVMAQKLATHAAVFKGDRGLSVVVAPTADDKAALVKVQGVNSPVDGVVFLADKVVNGKRLSYRSTLDGSPWNIVVNEDLNSWGSNFIETRAFLPPALRDGYSLSYDEKASKALDLSALQKTYQKQKGDGVQAKLARFNRDNFVATTEQRLKEADDRASKTCGVPVKTSVNWASVSEDQMKRLSVGGYCETVSQAMGLLCTSDAAYKTNRAAQNGNITCQIGDKLNLVKQDGKTVFTTVESAPNQDDFALQFLRNQ